MLAIYLAVMSIEYIAIIYYTIITGQGKRADTDKPSTSTGHRPGADTQKAERKEKTMKKAELRKALEQYQELQQQITSLEAQKAKTADQIKAYMEQIGADEIQVDDTTARYREVTSSRLDTAALKENHPKIYRMFCRPQTVRRFSVA